MNAIAAFARQTGASSQKPSIPKRRRRQVAAQRQRLDGWLQRYGAWVVVSVRFLYGFRIAGPVLIGASGMAWTRFAAFNALGAVLWAVLLTGLGWFFGQAAQALLGKAQLYEGWLALGVIVVALGYALWSRRRARRSAGPGQGR